MIFFLANISFFLGKILLELIIRNFVPFLSLSIFIFQLNDAKRPRKIDILLDRLRLWKTGRIWWPPSRVNIRVIETSLSIGIALLLRYRCHLRCRLLYYYFRLLQKLPSARDTRSRAYSSNSPDLQRNASFSFKCGYARRDSLW